jgi:ATPase subunit of ABC transporter with duplicated ATPase domains
MRATRLPASLGPFDGAMLVVTHDPAPCAGSAPAA